MNNKLDFILDVCLVSAGLDLCYWFCVETNMNYTVFKYIFIASVVIVSVFTLVDKILGNKKG